MSKYLEHRICPLKNRVILHQADSVSLEEQLQRRGSERKRFRPDIEGLRAVAVLGVVLFHAQIPGIGGGFVGVDVFFVISGFLITGLLWREANTTGAVRIGRFFGARARRLLPASATVGVITMLGAVFMLGSPLQARTVIIDGIASALYVSNYRFAMQGVDYLAADLAPSLFQQYWSLGVEEQFYLIWPALIIGTAWFIRRAHRRTMTQATSSQRPYLLVLAAVAALSFALSLIVTYSMPPMAFYSLPSRAWQLAIGGLIALTADLWHRVPRFVAAVIGWAGLAVIFVAFHQFSANTLYPGIAALLPTLGTALVIGAGCSTPAHGCGRLLVLPPMLAIGRVSYSWYLWHWPILLVTLWGIAPLTGHAIALAMSGVLLSFVLALLTLRFVENPLRFAPKIRNSTRRSLGLGAVATAVAVCTGVALLSVVPNPIGTGTPAATLAITVTPVPAGSDIGMYDEAVQKAFTEVKAMVAASIDLKAVPSNLSPSLADSAAGARALQSNGCMLGFFQTTQPECATGETTSTTSIALVGDSNAAMWDPAFQQVATQRHWRLETMSKAGCPLMDLHILDPRGREYKECAEWRSRVLARLEDERPALIVLAFTRLYGTPGEPVVGISAFDRAWIDGLNRLVSRLRGTGAKVLVLGPIPNPQTWVADCLASHLEDAMACSAETANAVNQLGITDEAAATRAAGGAYVDLTSLFCTVDRCPVVIGNTLMYFDKRHITDEYSRLLAPAIGALTDHALAQTSMHR